MDRNNDIGDYLPPSPPKQYVNLTPHTINLGDKVISPSGVIARIEEIPIRKNRYMIGQIKNLPDQKENHIYIVSKPVAMFTAHRQDVFFPDKLNRDQNGNVIGCESLGQYIDAEDTE